MARRSLASSKLLASALNLILLLTLHRLWSGHRFRYSVHMFQSCFEDQCFMFQNRTSS